MHVETALNLLAQGLVLSAPFISAERRLGAVLEALEAIGPAAEPAVLKHLAHRDVHTRTAVIQLLGKIGRDPAWVSPASLRAGDEGGGVAPR